MPEMYEELEQKIKKELLDVLMREMDDFSFSESESMEDEGEPMAIIEEKKTMPLSEAKGEVEEILEEASSDSEEMPMMEVEEEDEDYKPRGFGQFVRSMKGK